MKRDLKVEINPEAWKDNSIFKENDNRQRYGYDETVCDHFALILRCCPRLDMQPQKNVVQII